MESSQKKTHWLVILSGLVSLINCMMLVAGVMGAWRDRVVVADAKMEALTISTGKTEGKVENIAIDIGKIASSTTVIAGDVSRLKDDVSDIKTTQIDQGKAIIDLQRRTDLLETLGKRTR